MYHPCTIPSIPKSARSCSDTDPYVRKTATMCVAKLYDINPELVEDQAVGAGGGDFPNSLYRHRNYMELLYCNLDWMMNENFEKISIQT